MDVYATLESTLGKEKVEEEIGKKLTDFHGLLTREVALKLIAKEHGLIKEEMVKINEIKPGMKRVILNGTISQIHKIVEYTFGKKCRTMTIKDETGTTTLTVWNDDVDIFSKLKVGDEIGVKNAYERLGSLNLGYNGSVEILKSAPYTKCDTLPENAPVNIRAFISHIQGTREYEKNGVKKQYYIFTVSDKTTEVRCIVWENLERTQKLAIGDEVIIQNATAKKNELHINANSRILARKLAHLISGKITEIGVKSNKLFLKIGDTELLFSREHALTFFGVTMHTDIDLETLIALKKESLLNTVQHIRCKEENGEWKILE